MIDVIPVYGGTVEWSNDSIAWTEIPGCTNVVIPEVSQDFGDVLNLDSPDGVREFTKGLKDGGERSLGRVEPELLRFLKGRPGVQVW